MSASVHVPSKSTMTTPTRALGGSGGAGIVEAAAEAVVEVVEAPLVVTASTATARSRAERRMVAERCKDRIERIRGRPAADAGGEDEIHQGTHTAGL